MKPNENGRKRIESMFVPAANEYAQDKYNQPVFDDDYDTTVDKLQEFEEWLDSIAEDKKSIEVSDSLHSVLVLRKVMMWLDGKAPQQIQNRLGSDDLSPPIRPERYRTVEVGRFAHVYADYALRTQDAGYGMLSPENEASPEAETLRNAEQDGATTLHNSIISLLEDQLCGKAEAIGLLYMTELESLPEMRDREKYSMATMCIDNARSMLKAWTQPQPQIHDIHQGEKPRIKPETKMLRALAYDDAHSGYTKSAMQRLVDNRYATLQSLAESTTDVVATPKLARDEVQKELSVEILRQRNYRHLR